MSPINIQFRFLWGAIFNDFLKEKPGISYELIKENAPRGVGFTILPGGGCFNNKAQQFCYGIDISERMPEDDMLFPSVKISSFSDFHNEDPFNIELFLNYKEDLMIEDISHQIFFFPLEQILKIVKSKKLFESRYNFILRRNREISKLLDQYPDLEKVSFMEPMTCPHILAH